ncbi:hypothetical protein R6Q57_028791 [Mikania cordata]
MSVNVVIFFGGKWEFINGAIEYVPFDCFRQQGVGSSGLKPVTGSNEISISLGSSAGIPVYGFEEKILWF